MISTAQTPVLSTLFAAVSFIGITGLRAEITPGEILISEMNCVACHDAPDAIKSRLASRQAPKLGADGVRPTAHWIREFLSDPQKTNPGTLMPDMLHALAPDQKAEAVEALTHYLVSAQGTAAKADRGASGAMIAEGERLYHDLGCVQCHAPTKLPTGRENDAAAKTELERLKTTSVPISPSIARKYTLGELTKFLRDPLKVRASGRMPSLKLSAPEAEAIAMFLLREQVPSGEAVALEGLQYELYEKEFPEIPEFDRLTATSTGKVAEPTLSVTKRKSGYAIRFSGDVNVSKEGRYNFYTESDDGTRLYIDGKLVVDNGGIHPSQERSGEVELKPGPHSFVLQYFQGGGEAELKVRWKGPGIDKQAITAQAYSHAGKPLMPVGNEPFAVDAAKAERGKALFAELNCAACHDMGTPGRKSKPLPQIAVRQPRGCIASKTPAHVPKFEINDRQRQVMLALLQEQTPINTPLTDEEQIRRTMTTLNCYACHHRDKRGGIEGLRRDYLASFGEVDWAMKAAVPPNLNGVGAKLQPLWLKMVLENGEKVRPYMATAHAAIWRAECRQAARVIRSRGHSARLARTTECLRAGRCEQCEQVRPQAGGCGWIDVHRLPQLRGEPIARHTRSGPGIDRTTTEMGLVSPLPARSPIAPARHAHAEFLAEWNRSEQGRAQRGRGAADRIDLGVFCTEELHGPPRGIDPGKARDRRNDRSGDLSQLYRWRRSRAIGVGYPEKANLCFDANEVRLAMLWHGSFIDAAKHRTGRGAGYEKPLGTDVIKAPPGPPFAILPSDTSSWPAEVGKEGGYRFLGYRLDEKQRPIFRYRFEEIDIEDYMVAVQGEVDADFRRTLTLKTDKDSIEPLYFRAAAGTKIEEAEGGSYLIDGRVKLRFPGATPRIRSENGNSELLVPVTFANGQAVITEEISW